MPLKLSNLSPAKDSKKKTRRRGRGNSSGRGNYSGRGINGQRSRSGGKAGLAYLGRKHLIKQFPKLSGFTSHQKKPAVVNLQDLAKQFRKGSVVDPAKMIAKGLIKKSDKRVKILGKGKLNKELTVRAHVFSASAEEAIKKAGGQAVEI